MRVDEKRIDEVNPAPRCWGWATPKPLKRRISHGESTAHDRPRRRLHHPLRGQRCQFGQGHPSSPAPTGRNRKPRRLRGLFKDAQTRIGTVRYVRDGPRVWNHRIGVRPAPEAAGFLRACPTLEHGRLLQPRHGRGCDSAGESGRCAHRWPDARRDATAGFRQSIRHRPARRGQHRLNASPTHSSRTQAGGRPIRPSRWPRPARQNHHHPTAASVAGFAQGRQSDLTSASRHFRGRPGATRLVRQPAIHRHQPRSNDLGQQGNRP